ncbi:MAG: hypothetical protein ACYSUX_08705 [Planctomycetota bacterium]|jgi:hypothetical protein
MKNLMFSTVPALIVAVVLLAFYPVFSAGQDGDPIVVPETSQSINCEELLLAIDTTVIDTDEPTIIRFYLVDFGGPFYIIHAALLPNPTLSDPDYKPIMMSGTGQVVESSGELTSSLISRVLYMNLSYSQEHADESPDSYWHDCRNAQISLDLSTLKGTFWMVGIDYDAASGEYSDGFDKLNLTLAGELPECLQQEPVPEEG